MKRNLAVASIITIVLAGCASAPRTAQEKTVEVDGKVLTFNGSYNEDRGELTLIVNGEPLMKGRFPPYTPTQNFNANYQDLALRSHCYFGSVLGEQGGAFGVVAGIIQSAKSSSADKCELYVNEKLVEHLYF